LLLISNLKNMTGEDTRCLGCDTVSLCEYVLAFKKKNCSAVIFSCMTLNAGELRIFQYQYLLAQQYNIKDPRRPVPIVTPTVRTSNLTRRQVPTTYVLLREWNECQPISDTRTFSQLHKMCVWIWEAFQVLHFSKVLMWFYEWRAQYSFVRFCRDTSVVSYWNWQFVNGEPI
jgi:hypothetical protein